MRPATAPTDAPDYREPERLKDAILTSLDDDKGEEIVAIDLRGRSPIADWMVVATGRSTRQVGAMADHLRERLGKGGVGVQIEGMPQGDWVLVDAGDVVVHLFRPEVRTFYQLEKMWAVDATPPLEPVVPRGRRTAKSA